MRKIAVFLVAFVLIFGWSFNKPAPKIKVYFRQMDKAVKMNFDEYVCGVVAAEMPSSFEAEALKAQAVAVSTYSMRRIKIGKNHKKGAHVCTDNRHCQAYKSIDDIKGTDAEKIKRVVKAVSGQVLIYKGELIDAVYHSASDGYTKSSAEVWGGDVPYLQSVPTPWEKEMFDLSDTKGHGVGMSQYGAQGMALSGYTYEDILKHYYTGTEIVKY